MVNASGRRFAFAALVLTLAAVAALCAGIVLALAGVDLPRAATSTQAIGAIALVLAVSLAAALVIEVDTRCPEDPALFPDGPLRRIEDRVHVWSTKSRASRIHDLVSRLPEPSQDLAVEATLLDMSPDGYRFPISFGVVTRHGTEIVFVSDTRRRRTWSFLASSMESISPRCISVRGSDTDDVRWIETFGALPPHLAPSTH